MKQPFSSQLLVLPWLNFKIPLQLPPGLTVMNDIPVPMHYMGWLLDDYARNARQRVNIAVYQVECWKPGSSVTGAASLTIPFCSRLEIGINVLVSKYICEHPDLKDVSFDAVFPSKGFRSYLHRNMSTEVPQMAVSYREMDMAGETRALAHQVQNSAENYVHISCSNTIAYTAGPEVNRDLASPCSVGSSPEAQWLGLRCVPMRPAFSDLLKKEGQKKVTSLPTRRSCKRPNLRASRNFWMSLSMWAWRNFSSSAQSPFSILVDGSIFGPFQKVKISSMCLDMPVMTFLDRVQSQ